MWLVIFADGFAEGMTWSGLNPDGGGPGFLLLVSVGMISFFGRSGFEKSCSAVGAILIAVVASALCGVVVFTLVNLTGTLPVESTPALVSGVICSYLVPRVVVAVLDDTWSRAEGQEPARVSAMSD